MQRIRNRGRELGIKRFSVLPIIELKEKILEAERKIHYDKTVTCQSCLEERLKQRLIDDKLYNQKTFGNVVRGLVCDYCSHDSFTHDGDAIICIQCGALRGAIISDEGDYFSNKIKQKQTKKKKV
jgi:hypothetical protein